MRGISYGPSFREVTIVCNRFSYSNCGLYCRVAVKDLGIVLFKNVLNRESSYDYDSDGMIKPIFNHFPKVN